MKRVWCEWDIGAENVVFTSDAAAMKWLEENEGLADVIGEDQMFANVQDIFDAGLLGFTDLEVL